MVLNADQLETRWIPHNDRTTLYHAVWLQGKGTFDYRQDGISVGYLNFSL